MSVRNVDDLNKNLLYRDQSGPTVEKARLGLPDRWLHCPRKGQITGAKFIPFKTPLCCLYDDQIPESQRFTPQMVFTAGLGKIGLWIDLTKTNRYYSRIEVEREQCQYQKMSMEGHGSCPDESQTLTFVALVREFISSHPRQLVAVHCTHGFNRTGFLIVSYLAMEQGWAVEAAVKEFASMRPPGIYKHDYLRELFRRFEDVQDTPTAPEKPLWTVNETNVVEDSGTSSGMGEKAAVFMDGQVPMVKAVEDPVLRAKLMKKAQVMCGYRKNGFPGSQPISMDRENLQLLAKAYYKVSWKADGLRYMLLIDGRDRVFALDRNDHVFHIPQLTFPHRKEQRHVRNTLIDGEMVIDKVIRQGLETNTPRYLVYDIVQFEEMDIGNCDFDRRLLCIRRELIETRTKAMEKGEIIRENETMSVRLKDFYDVVQPYHPGRCDQVLKWKPPNLNSVDFKLRMTTDRRPGMLPEVRGELWLLSMAVPFATMKLPRELRKFDGKIVECTFDAGRWIFLRERSDKKLPNAVPTAVAVCNSIQNPISKEMLLEFIDKNVPIGRKRGSHESEKSLKMKKIA